MQNFFKEHNINNIIQRHSDRNHTVFGDTIYTLKPKTEDLESLYNLVLRTTRTTILEFGCGWSSLVFSLALENLKKEFKEIKSYKRNTAFECHSIDNYKKYIKIARNRLDDPHKVNSHFHYSEVKMTQWRGCIATEYQKLPQISPDLIYIDGPDQYKTRGNINGLTTASPDFMPMSCDVLKFEHFLMPKTIIVVDGRAANARFLRCNLQRRWDYKYCQKRDQHFFVLEEDPFGPASEKVINELYYRRGMWAINDL